MRIYTSRFSSGIPLGGLGTGSIEIWPDGSFKEWLIFNNRRWGNYGEPEFYINDSDLAFMIRIAPEGSEPVVRLLKAGFWVETDQDLTYRGCGPSAVVHPYHMPWFRPVREVEFTGKPPMAILKFTDPSLKEYGVDVELEAFGSLIPGNVNDSAIPAAFLKFNLVNRGRVTVELSLMGVVRNPHRISEEVGVVNKLIEGEGYSGVSLSGLGIPRTHGMFNGELALVFMGGFDSAVTLRLNQRNRGEFINALRRLMVDFRGDGLLSGVVNDEAYGVDLYSAITKGVRLKPGESASIVLIIAWYYPNHIDNSGRLVGHYYENLFKNVKEVLDYSVRNFNRLYGEVKEFVNSLYDANYDEWIIDLAISQLTTLPKSTWLTKDGYFAVWEGGPGCCGLTTLDVALWGIVGIALLYPDLAIRVSRQFSSFILKPGMSPFYEMFALAFPENMRLYREALAKDPTIQHDIDKFRNTVRAIVEKTGLDPSGRVPHAFRASESSVDGYDRNDLMPEFILMSLLNYYWTGDSSFLREIWGSIRDVIEAMLRQHNEAKLNLPYHTPPSGYEGSSQVANELGRDWRERELLRLLFSGPMYFYTTVNTFDAMSLLGIATFTSDLWVAALKAALSVAGEAGDEAYVSRLSEVLNSALANFTKYLWNGEYFDLWFDPVSNLRDNAVMTAGLTGEWYLKVLLGLDYAVDKDKVTSMLRAIYRNNFKKGEGLINASYPGKPRPSLAGDLKYFNGTGIPYNVSGQMDTPWTGIEIPVAMHMIWEGLVNEGLEVLRSVHERYVDYGLYWNHVECDGHYFRPLVSLDIPNALAGFRYIGRDKSISINPRIKTPIRGPVLAPGSVMTLDYGENEVKLIGRVGELEVGRITLSGFMGKSIRVFYNGAEVKAIINIEDGRVSITLDNPVKLQRGSTLTIIGY